MAVVSAALRANAALLEFVAPPELFTNSFDVAAPSCEEPQIGADVSFANLSALALCRNPDIHVAWAQLVKQRAAVNQGLSGYYPQLEASSYVGRISKTIDYDKVDFTQHSTARTDNVQANLTWLLYDFGARKAGVTSGRLLLDAALSANVAATQSVLFEIGKRFSEYAARKRTLDAFAKAEEAALASVAIADAQYRAGVGQLSNKLLFASSEARARVNWLQAKAALDDAKAALFSYAGLSAASELNIILQDNARLELDDIVSGELSDLLKRVLQDNPSVRAAREQLDAAEQNVALASAQGLPTVTLALSGSRSNALPSDQVAQRTTAFTAIVQLKLPLFDGYLQHSKLQGALAEQLLRQAEVVRAERDASLEAWQAFRGYETGVARLRAARELLNVTERSTEVARGRLKAGVGDAFEVVRSQDDVSNAMLQVIDATKTVELSKIQLARALGTLK